MYNIIILIIASDNKQYYIEMQQLWKKYMNIHPNIKSYFTQLYERYNNDKKPLKKDLLHLKLVVPPEINSIELFNTFIDERINYYKILGKQIGPGNEYFILLQYMPTGFDVKISETNTIIIIEKKIKDYITEQFLHDLPLLTKPAFFRSDSKVCSIKSVEHIFNIYNNNNINKIKFKQKDHGGGVLHSLITLNIISYFILNTKPQTFLSNNSFDLIQIFQLNDVVLIKRYLSEMKTLLENIVRLGLQQ